MQMLTGAVRAGGALFALVGIGKVIRPTPGDAVRNLLHLGHRKWRVLQTVTGVTEFMIGGAVTSGAFPRITGAAMALMGLAFLVLLFAIRRAGISGDCGCLPWQSDKASITWRSAARAGLVVGTGAVDALIGRTGLASPGLGFGLSAAAASSAWTALSVNWPLRIPPCHWRPVHAASDAFDSLVATATYRLFADSHGPFSPLVRYRRLGCRYQFCFTPSRPMGGDELRFDVARGHDGGIAVHAEVQMTQDDINAAHFRQLAHRLREGLRPTAAYRARGSVL